LTAAPAVFPAGDLFLSFLVRYKEKNFGKNNMVSNDSKLPNSARNRIKKILAVAENGGDRREQRSNRRFFYFNLLY